MDFDNSWAAFLDPGKADVYFDQEGMPLFVADAVSFSLGNAWWLAELSRLIYRRQEDETSRPVGPGRNHFLEAHGLQETTFFNRHGIQCALVESVGADNPFAVLVFRGSSQPCNWFTDINCMSSRCFSGGMVHRGFLAAFDMVWPELEKRLESMIEESGGRTTLYYAGHSLGAALATLAAVRRKPHALYTFGSPKTGDRDFIATLNCPVFRLVNNRDVVTELPPELWPLNFTHTGGLHYITHDSRLLVEPSRAAVVADRRQSAALRRCPDDERFMNPPQFLADHAPVNYVAHLQRAVTAVSLNGQHSRQ